MHELVLRTQNKLNQLIEYKRTLVVLVNIGKADLSVIKKRLTDLQTLDPMLQILTIKICQDSTLSGPFNIDDDRGYLFF